MIVFNCKGKIIPKIYSTLGAEINVAYSADGSALPDSGFAIKVMEYNVGQWYLGNHDNVPADKDTEYYNLQNSMIQSANADIAFLCEYVKEFSKTGRTALSLLSQYFPYIYERAGTSTTSGTQCAICSKYPISDYQHNQYHSDSGLYYDSCKIVVNNVPIRLIITHLHWDNRTLRLQEFDVLMNYVANYPNFILAGDFNTAATSTSDTDYPLIIEPMLERGYHVANANGVIFLPTYNYNDVDKCLDNIVTSDNIAISNVYVDTTKKTDLIDEKVDHMPLIATLTVN